MTAGMGTSTSMLNAKTFLSTDQVLTCFTSLRSM